MAIVVILLLLATAGFARRVTARVGGVSAIPSIAHPVDASTADCASCHEVGDEGMPESHRTYAVPTCLTCHRL